jgi:eukaryotic-like serine/threonine-protein kinase
MSPLQGSVDGFGRRGRTPDATVPGFTARSRARDAGAGEVWSAVVDATGAECTVRRLRLPPDTVARDEALRAARRIQRARHPHLVAVLDVVPTADGLAVVSVPVGGAVSLARLLDARERLDPGEVVTIGLPLAQALGAAHAAGVPHGEISADDVLLEPDGRPVLAGTGAAPLVGVAASPAQDVRDLASLLLGAMPHAVGPDAAAVAVAVAPALVDDPARRPSADDLADALARTCVPLPVRGIADVAAGAALAPVRSLADVRAEAVGAKAPTVGGRRGGRAARRSPREGRVPPVGDLLGDRGPGAGGSGDGNLDDRGPTTLGSGAAAGRSRPVGGRRGESADRGRWMGAVEGVTSWLSRSGRAPLVVGVGLIVVLAVVGLVVARGSGGGTAAGTATPARASAGASKAAVPPRAGTAGASAASPSVEEGAASWRMVLDGLNTARSAVFETGSAARLADVDAPGSPAYAADQDSLRQMVARNAHSSPLREEVSDLVVRQAGATRVVLRVADQLLAYQFLDPSGKVLASEPSKGTEHRDITLVRVAGTWRIYSQTAAPS